MSSQPKIRISPEEYLAIERRAEHKSEYINGEVFVMSGGSRQHNTITVNVSSSIHAQVRQRPGVVYSSDQRVKVSATGLYTYPDITILCGEAVFDDDQQDTLTNPTVIIEVLSKTAAGYDRNEKFANYRKLSSLAEYVLISQTRPHIELYTRQPDGQWLLSESDDPTASIRLASIDCSLALGDVYEKVVFES